MLEGGLRVGGESYLNGILAEEREVIGVCLKLLYVGDGQVVRAETRGGLGLPSDEVRVLAFLRDKLDGLCEETLADFREKNRRRHPVEPDLNPGGLLRCVGEEEFGRIFQDAHGWFRFREMFPDSDGTLRISRVGFDGEVTQALVYAGQQFDWSTGSSGFRLFSKLGGEWRAVGRAGSDIA